MVEPVRLVIWDLDETFWKGTLTEGGITEYVRAHHDIVIALARRGILSSICSKNDASAVMPILEREGIADYFIFPSISWAPKGARIAQIIEDVQLRAPTVLFVDDNPNNLAEAQAFVPGLQAADETTILAMLDDPRFTGKDDSALTRLAQYKLLEQKKQDESSSAGSNEDFLRSCDVRVMIDYDIENNLDRAIELINRTNQLNFTKRRFPEDMDEARAALRALIAPFSAQAGLVRVADKYGDYGYVGFFLLTSGRKTPSHNVSNTTLQHFCFSCRTLGMLVEQWLYETLRRPELDVSGEVLTDLSVPRTIDWVRQVDHIENEAPAEKPAFPLIRMIGGCEANAVSIYLSKKAETIEVVGNYSASGLFVRVNSGPVILDAEQRTAEEFGPEAEKLGLPTAMSVLSSFADVPEGTLFAISPMRDAEGYRYYRHKEKGWKIHFTPIGQDPLHDMIEPDPAELEAQIQGWTYMSEADRAHLVTLAAHLRSEYESVAFGGNEERERSVREMLDRIPAGSKAVFYLDQDKWRVKDGTLHDATWVRSYTNLLRGIVADYPYAGVVSFNEAILDDSEIQVGGNHVDRQVYVRVADLIAEVAAGLTPKP